MGRLDVTLDADGAGAWLGRGSGSLLGARVQANTAKAESPSKVAARRTHSAYTRPRKTR